MRRWTVLVFIIAAALLSVPVSLGAQDQPPERTLNVVETIPAPGEEHGLSDPVTFYFDAALDCATAGAGVEIAGAAGTTVCAGSSLVFTPDVTLLPATVYTLTIPAATLRSTDGASLAEPFSLELTTRGYLQVTSTIPSDGSAEVESNSEVTVIFNRPVVPLSPLEEQAGFPQPLVFDPPLAGQGAWIGTSVYQFVPDPSLAGGTDYTVTIGGVTALDGAALAEPFSFSFSTQNPAVTRFEPTAEETGLPLTQKIQITFNQPMDRASTEAAFFLSIQEVPGEIAGAFEWNDNDTGFMYTPAERLVLETSYVYGFAADEALNAARTQAVAPFGINFYTAPFPAIVETYPSDGQVGAPPYNGVVLTFSSLINPETVVDKIIVEPAPEEIDGYFAEYNLQYTAGFQLRGDTAYTVTVLPGIEDVYGNTIESTTTFSFTTRDLDSEMSLNIPYMGIGIYDADRAATELYVTHMNVEQVNLGLYEVNISNILGELLSQEYYDMVRDLSFIQNPLIKSWSIEGAELRNARRLDLVDIGAPGGSAVAPVNGVTVAQCPGAMPSRAQVGDRAQVITDPDPTRARSEPVTGDIVELMYKGYAFQITGGPACRDGIVWWQIQLREGDSAWVAEGLNGEYFFEITETARAASVPLSSMTLEGGPLPVGPYLLRANASGPVGTEDDRLHLMLVSDTALLMKRGSDTTIVWATDIHTGTPAVGIPVFLYLSDMDPMTVYTDDQGVATFTYPRRTDLYSRSVALVDDGERFGITASDWTDGLYPYQFGIDVDTQPAAFRTYMYTDRPVYRPGQPVHFRGVVRARQDNDYQLTEFDAIEVAIYSSTYDVLYTEMLPLSDYGSFSGTFTLDDDAVLGYYSIEANLPIETENNYINKGQISFDVAEYRLPEFQVTVTPESAEVMQGETIRAVVDSRYFFGGPVSNAAIDYYVSLSAYYFDYTGAGTYSFSPQFDTRDSLGDSSYDTATTDSSGLFTVELPAETSANGRSVTYTIEAVARDESGQSVSGRAEVVVHQGAIYVGIAARDFIGAVGQPVNLDLITVDWDSAIVPGQTVNIEVVEQRWNSVQELDPYSASIVWKSEVEYIPVTTGTAATDADGKAEFSFVPPNGGIFRTTASVVDANGHTVSASNYVWVSGGGFVAWEQNNSTGIDLIADKTSYSVGDTAEILITSPFMGRTEALVTLERDGVLRTERLTLESNSTVYRVPIEDDFAPMIYVGVVLIKGVDANTPVADMRVGYVALPVDNERLELNVEITPDTEIAGPRDTVTYTIRATDFTGAPVQAELGVALTDLAALSVGRDNAEPILDYYYGTARLAVLMSSGMILNTDLITEFTRDVIKGGGGGGGGDFGILELREQFIDTAFWDGQIVTDENGTATVSITLPDNLTTWRLNVIGVTDGSSGPMLVGQASDDIIATKPLIVRPVAPRFMTRGDVITLAAVVNNNTLEDLPTQVSLQAMGVTLSEDITQTVTIPAQGRSRVNWTATVEDVETAELIFVAESGEFNDATRPAFGQGDNRLLPVYKYEVPEFVGTGGTLRTASSRVEAVVLPRRYAVTEGTLTVELEPSLAVAALKAIEALRRIECECTETTAARLSANVAGLRALEALGDPNDPRIAALQTEASLAVQRLVAQQKVDGGWAWFPSLESSPLVTSWVLVALTEAQQNLMVDGRVIQEGARYLTQHLSTRSRSDQDYLLNRSAIIVYALSMAGETRVTAPISNLYDLRDRLSVYAKALLLSAILEVAPDDSERIITLRDEILNAVIVSANGAHWEEQSRDWYNWNSNTRTTAMVVRTLLSLVEDEPLLPNAIRWLMIARDADYWETTQETAWSLFALTDWMITTGETQPSFSYTVTINGEQAAETALTPADAATSEILTRDVSQLIADGPNPIEITRGAGDGALYYTAYLEAFLPVPEVQPIDNGLSVSRVYRILGQEETIAQAAVGQLVEVTVTVIAPNALNFVVIEDPLPAGVEAINPNLNTSQQTDTEATFESTGDDFFYYWWADVQYKDEKVVLSADYVAPGTYEFTYLVRPTVEGTYNVIPPTGREFYLPEVYGRGAGSTFTVVAAEE